MAVSRVQFIVPIAGASQRFVASGYKIHKAFLPLHGRKSVLQCIFESVIPYDFDLHLVCTVDQNITYAQEIYALCSEFSSLTVHVIPSHQIGPVFTVLNLDIDESLPVVIHYCDFLVEGDLTKLINHVRSGHLSAPVFHGFHPASFGSTTFAYLKVNSLFQLIQLREKRTFSENKIQEYASTGIYGFPSYGIYKKLALNLLSQDLPDGLSEAYVSLCLNQALHEGLITYCHVVDKFICLGTPHDYLQYLHWMDMYSDFKHAHFPSLRSTSYVVTACGKGTRFQKESYLLPKIFLKFQGQSLINHSLLSVKSSRKYAAILSSHFCYSDALPPDTQKIYFESTPTGQLQTLKSSIHCLDQEDPVLVSSADYISIFSESLFAEFLSFAKPDIVIFTIPWSEHCHAPISNYGFVECSDDWRVSSIIEKPSSYVSPLALKNLLIGTFWFRNPELISCIENNYDNGEPFIASSLSTYINSLKICSFPVDTWISLGTPYELDLAAYWFDFFDNLNERHLLA